MQTLCELRKQSEHFISVEERISCLKKSDMFRAVDDSCLALLAEDLVPVIYHKGEILVRQDESQTKMFIIVKGKVLRKRLQLQQIHVVDLHSTNSSVTFGAFHLLNQVKLNCCYNYKDPSFATAVCTSDSANVYVLDTETLLKHLEQNSLLSIGIIKSLSKSLRPQASVLRTPLLRQEGRSPLWRAISMAGFIESFYRSLLNSLINRHLTGKSGPLFPQMHIQLPTRIFYLNGFKGLRYFFDLRVSQEAPLIQRITTAISPGLIMTPVSSVLEACNAKITNLEPLRIRWTRGIIPRSLREVIFGIGLNNLSDFYEERMSSVTDNPTLQTALGCLVAGSVSGYLSHIPHNLSTLKLLDPNSSYKHHYNSLVQKSTKRLPSAFPMRDIWGSIFTVIAPSGVGLRTVQIIGSYTIINNVINFFSSE